MSAKPKRQRDPLTLVAVLVGLALGGLNLLSLTGRLSREGLKLSNLREQVESMRSTAEEASTLEEEGRNLEVQVRALLGEPIPESTFVPTVAMVAIQSGWKDLTLQPAKDQVEGSIRYRTLEATWTATWKDLLAGIDALKRRGIFLKELEVNVGDKDLQFKGFLTYLEPAEEAAPKGGSRRSP